jgi:hypothetical protein
MLGFGQAAHDVRMGISRPWLVVGVAIDAFRMGYRAGLAAAASK